MKRTIALLSFLLFAVAPVFAVGDAPDQLVRANTERILGLIKTNQEIYAKDEKKLQAMVYDVVLPHFDFRKMSQLVLALSWREATEEQRKRFTEEFRDLLVRAYSTVLLKYNDEEVVYFPYHGKADDRTATVRVEVRRKGGKPPVNIQYDFYVSREGTWRVYDVTVDGVSLVTSYRTTYAERIRADGLDALIANLARDNKSGTPATPIIGPKDGKS